MTDNDFDIIEPSEYSHQKDEVYSHSSLVMSALKQCKDKRSQEMRDGYFNRKFDRMGNAHNVWIPDSRQEFIESVEALMMIQERDYDDKAKDKIEKLKETLNIKFKELCEQEKEEWNVIPYEYKQKLAKNGSYFREGMLSKDLPYLYSYLRYKIEIYTQIVSEIQQLIKRFGDYQEQEYEN